MSTLGRLGGDEILERMAAADFVCIPSRPAYPEGLPLTIYEAMASGTPIVASDHPMFVGVVRDGDTGFVFPAGDPARLADVVRDAWDDPVGYERVSRNAAAAYATLGLSTLWADLLERWVRGIPDDLSWLESRALGQVSRTQR